MSAAEYVFDPVDYGEVDQRCAAAITGGMDVANGPTSASHRRALPFATEGGTMNKSTVRSVAYFMIVGGIVVWIVGHLAPIRA